MTRDKKIILLGHRVCSGFTFVVGRLCIQQNASIYVYVRQKCFDSFSDRYLANGLIRKCTTCLL